MLCLLTARLLCLMAVAMDSFSASERLDFSQCVTKIDLSSVGPIFFVVCRSIMPSMYADHELGVYGAPLSFCAEGRNELEISLTYYGGGGVVYTYIHTYIHTYTH